MRKAVFLDRDGTINVDKDYLYKIEDFEYLPGVIEGLRLFQDLGYTLIVLTNQSGIARGFYTEKDYKLIEMWMENDLKSKGIKISASYFCPHLPDAPIKKYNVLCDCRKPKLGMFRRAMMEWDLDIDKCIAIGDKMRDLAICKVSGCKGYLISKSEFEFVTEAVDHITCVQDWDTLINFIKGR
ncbi:MAG: HAD family hydrolase [Butyrivibrio sp.]|nr:HAD family hydrolase [Butyrivibrio sp.]